jgi:hypothetical protein
VNASFRLASLITFCAQGTSIEDDNDEDNHDLARKVEAAYYLAQTIGVAVITGGLHAKTTRRTQSPNPDSCHVLDLHRLANMAISSGTLLSAMLARCFDSRS